MLPPGPPEAEIQRLEFPENLFFFFSFASRSLSFLLGTVQPHFPSEDSR